AVTCLMSACVSTPEARTTQVGECDLSGVLARTDIDPYTLCTARALAKRCSASDQCFIRCESRGGLPQIGGGCSHVCHSQVLTDEQYAKEGPSFTEEAAACYRK